MKKNTDINELIVRVRLGRREDMDKLIEFVQPRVYAYIYRSTLDNELTDDLVQETLLQMLKSISSLQEIERFWPWMYRIATGKINDFFRVQKRSRSSNFSTLEDSLLASVLQDDSQQVSETVVRKELGKLIIKAMSKLKHQQRAVIALL